MRLLLDTHAFRWWIFGDASLSRAASAALSSAENEIFVSAASAWEIATKHRIGKLKIAPNIVADMERAIEEAMALVSNERAFDQFGVARLW